AFHPLRRSPLLLRGAAPSAPPFAFPLDLPSRSEPMIFAAPPVATSRAFLGFSRFPSPTALSKKTTHTPAKNGESRLQIPTSVAPHPREHHEQLEKEREDQHEHGLGHDECAREPEQPSAHAPSLLPGRDREQH